MEEGASLLVNQPIRSLYGLAHSLTAGRTDRWQAGAFALLDVTLALGVVSSLVGLGLGLWIFATIVFGLGAGIVFLSLANTLAVEFGDAGVEERSRRALDAVSEPVMIGLMESVTTPY